MIRIFLILCFSMSFGENRFSIPFSNEAWYQLNYSKIKSNQVRFEPDKLRITVNKSASPLIFPFEQLVKINSIRVRAKLVQGKININENNNQLETKFDDFIFRLGAVFEGDKKLGFFKKKIAPMWIKELFKLNQTETGISHIEFFNIYSSRHIKESSRRQHPSSKLMYENFYALISPDGEIKMDIPLEHINKNIVALWLSSDGDQTSSSFKIDISDISIIY